ncbi:hypothetical protein F5X68DRAFT_68819 [Plectosphaerella plurivora]|uniref:Secreted protein n=1 Tax=Plectosphaerella plurivora TaxID=936078 RepID=A0A9P8VFL7_9PEZI|nr:hypothetical protein F5X68DRAFT_68819 [Plectosphaerella plurivora]
MLHCVIALPYFFVLWAEGSVLPGHTSLCPVSPANIPWSRSLGGGVRTYCRGGFLFPHHFTLFADLFSQSSLLVILLARGAMKPLHGDAGRVGEGDVGDLDLPALPCHLPWPVLPLTLRLGCIALLRLHARTHARGPSQIEMPVPCWHSSPCFSRQPAARPQMATSPRSEHRPTDRPPPERPFSIPPQCLHRLGSRRKSATGKAWGSGAG